MLMLLFLVYHKIKNRSGDDLHTVSRDAFLAQLSLVQAGKLPILNPRLLSCSNPTFKSGVILTFDDGTLDHFRIVDPLLRERGIQALFYVSTGKLNSEKYLTSEQVRQLWENGHTIGSHSHAHKRLDLLPRDHVWDELEASAMAIEKIVGERPAHFAPPGGFYNSTVQDLAQSAGYSFFRTMDWGYNQRLDPLQIEVLPMTGSLGFYFIRYALDTRSDWMLKSLCKLKSGLRTSVSASNYSRLRALVAGFSRRD
jgi:peptidoglycan/xylan/chitin deacetylase (PgdA/CDA1 family)